MGFLQNTGINLRAAGQTFANAIFHPIDTASYGLNESIGKPARKVHSSIKGALDKSGQNFDANAMPEDSYQKGSTSLEMQGTLLRSRAIKAGR